MEDKYNNKKNYRKKADRLRLICLPSDWADFRYSETWYNKTTNSVFDRVYKIISWSVAICVIVITPLSCIQTLILALEFFMIWICKYFWLLIQIQSCYHLKIFIKPALIEFVEEIMPEWHIDWKYRV